MFTFYPSPFRNNTSPARSSWNTLQREMDRWLDDFTPGSSVAAWKPECDIEESDKYFLLTLEVPGVDQDKIQIEAHDGQLVISGEREDTRKSEGGQRYTERRYGQFTRAFTLPSEVDEAKIEAHFENGILRVLVPKAEATAARRVKITSGKNEGFFQRLLKSPTEKNEKEAMHSRKEGSKGELAS